MDDFAAIYINITTNDGGEYLRGPLGVLMDHGWRPAWDSFSYMTFPDNPMDISDTERVEVTSEDYDAFWKVLIQLEADKTDIIELALFWKHTKQYIDIDFRPEGMMSIGLHGYFAPIPEEIDLVEQRIVKPLQEAEGIEFLAWECLHKDDEEKDSGIILDEVETENEYITCFTSRTPITLQSLSIKVDDINPELLNRVKVDTFCEIIQEHKDTRISLHRTGELFNVGADISTGDALETLGHFREMVRQLIEDIPGSRKVADGPNVYFGTHSVAIELCNPPLEKVVGYLQDVLNLVYKLGSDEELLFLYE